MPDELTREQKLEAAQNLIARRRRSGKPFSPSMEKIIAEAEAAGKISIPKQKATPAALPNDPTLRKPVAGTQPTKQYPRIKQGEADIELDIAPLERSQNAKNKSVLGFLGNAIKDVPITIGETFKGLYSIPAAVLGSQASGYQAAFRAKSALERYKQFKDPSDLEGFYKNIDEATASARLPAEMALDFVGMGKEGIVTKVRTVASLRSQQNDKSLPANVRADAKRKADRLESEVWQGVKDQTYERPALQAANVAMGAGAVGKAAVGSRIAQAGKNVARLEAVAKAAPEAEAANAAANLAKARTELTRLKLQEARIASAENNVSTFGIPKAIGAADALLTKKAPGYSAAKTKASATLTKPISPGALSKTKAKIANAKIDMEFQDLTDPTWQQGQELRDIAENLQRQVQDLARRTRWKKDNPGQPIPDVIPETTPPPAIEATNPPDVLPPAKAAEAPPIAEVTPVVAEVIPDSPPVRIEGEGQIVPEIVPPTEAPPVAKPVGGSVGKKGKGKKTTEPTVEYPRLQEMRDVYALADNEMLLRSKESLSDHPGAAPLVALIDAELAKRGVPVEAPAPIEVPTPRPVAVPELPAAAEAPPIEAPPAIEVAPEASPYFMGNEAGNLPDTPTPVPSLDELAARMLYRNPGSVEKMGRDYIPDLPTSAYATDAPSGQKTPLRIAQENGLTPEQSIALENKVFDLLVEAAKSTGKRTARPADIKAWVAQRFPGIDQAVGGTVPQPKAGSIMRGKYSKIVSNDTSTWVDVPKSPYPEAPKTDIRKIRPGQSAQEYLDEHFSGSASAMMEESDRAGRQKQEFEKLAIDIAKNTEITSVKLPGDTSFFHGTDKGSAIKKGGFSTSSRTVGYGGQTLGKGVYLALDKRLYMDGSPLGGMKDVLTVNHAGDLNLAVAYLEDAADLKAQTGAKTPSALSSKLSEMGYDGIYYQAATNGELAQGIGYPEVVIFDPKKITAQGSGGYSVNPALGGLGGLAAIIPVDFSNPIMGGVLTATGIAGLGLLHAASKHVKVGLKNLKNNLETNSSAAKRLDNYLSEYVEAVLPREREAALNPAFLEDGSPTPIDPATAEEVAQVRAGIVEMMQRELELTPEKGVSPEDAASIAEEFTKMGDKIAETFETLGQELVGAGLISEEAYAANKGRYLRRIYQMWEDPEGYLSTLEKKLVEEGVPKRVIGARLSEERRVIEQNTGRSPESVQMTGTSPSGRTSKAKLSARELTDNPHDAALREWMGEIGLSSIRVRRGGEITAREISKARLSKAVAEKFSLDTKRAEELREARRSSNEIPYLATRAEEVFYDNPDLFEQVRREDNLMGLGHLEGDTFYGKWIPKSVRKELIQGEYNPTTALQKWMMTWKLSKTAMNPSSWAGNVLGNIALAQIGGGMSALNPENYARASQSMRSRDAYFEAAMKVSDHPFESLRMEITTRQHLDPDIIYPSNIKNAISQAARAGKDNITNLYGGIDTVFKHALFIDTMDKLATIDPSMTMKARAQIAARQVAKTFPNFRHGTPIRLLRPTVRTLRRGAVPFISWDASILPIAARLIMEHPARIAAYPMIYQAFQKSLESWMQTQPGGRDAYDQEKRALPDYMDSYVRLPLSREKSPSTGEQEGAALYGDSKPLNPLTTLHDLSDNPLDALISRLNPVFSMLEQIRENRKINTEIPIYQEGETATNRAKAVAGFAAQQIVPYGTQFMQLKANLTGKSENPRMLDDGSGNIKPTYGLDRGDRIRQAARLARVNIKRVDIPKEQRGRAFELKDASTTARSAVRRAIRDLEAKKGRELTDAEVQKVAQPIIGQLQTKVRKVRGGG